ncbi:MAG: Triosephosphate isomerase [Parcubacteria group bacterium GW2011_GWA2_43_11]|nr:MAG: Triosephosphate isomerase [Parcubacteria group bacterium GW2011_GWA2_43_11]
MSNIILIANWKMNPKTSVEAKKIFSGIQKDSAKMNGVDVCICSPTIFLPELSKLLKSKKISLGAQDVFYEGTGAFTGQTSPEMVKPFKVTHTILGHSERRELGESNEFVARKVHHALNKGMTVVLCVGERERTDEGDYFTFIRDELEAVLSGMKRTEIKKIMIAYEPIWAIGKRAEEALDVPSLYEMVLFIRKILTEHFGRAPAQKVPILYGGSVKADNAELFVKEGGVNGLLVGSASLNPKEFIGISKAIVTKK